jgi:hypothetical protein
MASPAFAPSGRDPAEQRFDPLERAGEKEAARLADERALASGAKSRTELARENAFLPRSLARRPIDFTRIGRP